MGRPPSVETYLADVSEPGRSTLVKLRAIIRELAPEAAESIAYGMPAYKYRGKVLIYFGAAKKHLALYAVPGGTMRFGFEELPDLEFLRAHLAARMAEIDGTSTRRPARSPKA